MIAYLSGKLINKAGRALIIDVKGVGYQVYSPAPLLESAELHLPIELHIHTVVREDEISLYGFEKFEDLHFFEQLISINGVGPKLALDVLSSPMDEVKTWILSGNIPALTSLPGIGKKTAERIVLELKEKVALSSGEIPELAKPLSPEIQEEATHALLGLGYKRGDINCVFRSLKEPITQSEELIKYFLKHV